jgi:DNA-binding IclR family transcriptional regulator
VSHLDATAEVAGGADRVLAILTLLGSFPEGASLNELTLRTGAPRSSVHRALATLRRANLVEQAADGRYRVGFGLVKLAFSYYENVDVVRLIHPVLTTLADEYAETTHYARLEGDDVVYMAKVQSSAARYQLTSMVGGRNPAYCTGVGKALLAYRLTTSVSVEAYVDRAGGSLTARTKNTLTTSSALHREFTSIRRLGYALDRQENELGIHCLALPLFLTSSTVPDGAISITTVAQRWPLRELEATVARARTILHTNLGEVLQ